MRVGPHSHPLSRGDFAPRSGRTLPIERPRKSQRQSGTTTEQNCKSRAPASKSVDK